MTVVPDGLAAALAAFSFMVGFGLGLWVYASAVATKKYCEDCGKYYRKGTNYCPKCGKETHYRCGHCRSRVGG